LLLPSLFEKLRLLSDLLPLVETRTENPDQLSLKLHMKKYLLKQNPYRSPMIQHERQVRFGSDISCNIYSFVYLGLKLHNKLFVYKDTIKNIK